MTRDGEDDGINDRYRAHRASAADLAEEANETDYWFDADAVTAVLTDAAGDIDGDLFAFVGNDFGLALAFRPAGVARDRQNDVRRALLERGPDTDDVLAAIGDRIRATDGRIHKVLVAAADGDCIRYHCPSASSPPGFVTLSEAIGLVDFTTNGFKRGVVTRTY